LTSLSAESKFQLEGKLELGGRGLKLGLEGAFAPLPIANYAPGRRA